MKKIYSYFNICLLLVYISMTATCDGQTNRNTSDGDKREIANLGKIDAQIAEYVVEVFQDSKGNLWFGTMAKGVARYDGKELRYFTTKDGLCGNVISSIAEDKEGTLWFGSHTGLCQYDGKSFKTVWTTQGLHDQGTGWISVRSDKQGNIWASSNEGLYRYDGMNFSEFKVPVNKDDISSYSITKGRVSFALEDSHGNLWFKTDGDGAFRFNGESFSHFTMKDGLCSNNVTSIIEDVRGNIWFTCIQSYQPSMTGDGGVCRYDPAVEKSDSIDDTSIATETKIMQFPQIKGLSENDIYTIYEDTLENIWIGATGLGVYRFANNNFKLIDRTDRMDLTSRFGLQSALEDKNGELWFGFSGGLFKLEGESIVNVTQDGPWTQ